MKIRYKVTNIRTKASREQIIDEQVRHQSNDLTAVRFADYFMTAGSVEYLPIINIPIDLPIYRMANGRTRSIQ